MPYVSPHGVVKASAPPREKTQTIESAEKQDDIDEEVEKKEHIPSVDLGEVLEGRDGDPEVAEEMGHWSGFRGQKHELPDEKEYELEEILSPGDNAPPGWEEGIGQVDKAEAGGGMSKGAVSALVPVPLQEDGAEANLKAAEVVARA